MLARERESLEHKKNYQLNVNAVRYVFLFFSFLKALNVKKNNLIYNPQNLVSFSLKTKKKETKILFKFQVEMKNEHSTLKQKHLIVYIYIYICV